MEYEIKLVEKRMIAGFHMVGPWEQTVKQGFEQLMKWVDGKQIVPLEWIAVYYDNPDVVPAEKLRCDTVRRMGSRQRCAPFLSPHKTLHFIAHTCLVPLLLPF